MNAKERKGFTLAELLIVVAIIAVLVSIGIPVFQSQLEKSREATDLANVRSAYAEVRVVAMTEDKSSPLFQSGQYKKTVMLNQKKAGWEANKDLQIAGIVHGDSTRWVGDPGDNGGTCDVVYDDLNGIKLIWSGKAINFYPFASGSKPFTAYENAYANDSDLQKVLNGSKNFEIDSRCPNSSLVPAIKKHIEDNSLLQNGTWAFLGSTGKVKDTPNKQYLFWTSVNTNEVGANKKIPIIVQTSDGRFAVSTSTTGRRENSKGQEYIAVSGHLSLDGYEAVIKNGKTYKTLEEAYDAYSDIVYKDYPDYKASLLP